MADIGLIGLAVMGQVWSCVVFYSETTFLLMVYPDH